MLNRKKRYFIARLFTLTIVLINNFALSRAPINLFWPSDRPMLSDNWRGDCFQVTAAYEGAFKIHGFLPDDDDLCTCIDNREVNVLQLYGQQQNLVAGLNGFGPCSPCGALSQVIDQVNSGQLNDDILGKYCPYGNLKIPLNLMLAARWYFKPFFSLALFLPVYSMELKDIRFCPIASDQEDSILSCNYLNDPEIMGDLSLRPWKRTGIGDLISEFIWMRDYPQAKPLLRSVRLQTRWGLVFPTGLQENPDELLAFAFGNNGAWAGIGAFGLDLTFGSWVKAGIDAEFMYIFGHTKVRRVKTEQNQTDLLFLNKFCAYEQSGVFQQFNLYIDLYPHWGGSYIKINYQYLNQNDSRFFLKNISIDPRVVNTAENLQDWSTHSMIFFFNYDFLFECFNYKFLPTASFFYKNGFNGKRALLADTLGFRLSLNF